MSGGANLHSGMVVRCLDLHAMMVERWAMVQRIVCGDVNLGVSKRLDG